jgi:hypothetical protein
MRIAVVGLGAVGARAARLAASLAGCDGVVVTDADAERRKLVGDALEVTLAPVTIVSSHSEAFATQPDAVIVATPARVAGLIAEEALSARIPTVIVDGSPGLARDRATLDQHARRVGQPVVIGAGFSPGLSCVLALHAASQFDEVEEVLVSVTGAGGPACARGLMAYRFAPVTRLDQGHLVRSRRRGGPLLAYFPEPVGPRDTSASADATPFALSLALPDAQRITSWRHYPPLLARILPAPVARLARRRIPADLGAIRVEVRGMRAGQRAVSVYGAVDQPAGAAAAVATVVAARLITVPQPPGATGVGSCIEPLEALNQLAEWGVKAAVFDH